METATVEEFFCKLSENEESFQNLLKKAPTKDAKMKYVASFDKGKAETGIQMVTPDHAFYDLEGSDNIVLFFI